MNYIDDNFVLNKLKKRETDAHKGDFGKVLVFAGSVGMAGAAVLCGKSALKSGAGLVRFLLPSADDRIYTVLQTAVCEATCVFMDGEEGLNVNTEEKLNEYQAIAAGSGLGNDSQRIEFLKKIIRLYKGTLVLDADALNFISRDKETAQAVRESEAEIIITPHVGEAKRLLDTCEGIKGLESRKRAVSELAKKYNCIAVLKGSGTLVCRDDIIYENTTGNPGMATGGSGDCLSGVIASLAAQGYGAADAAAMGVFLHGKAGDLAAEKLSEPGLTAGDICGGLPYAIKMYYDIK